MKSTLHTPKRYDIFTFFNELDLLEIRLNILYDHVDYFVIVECAETFSGLPKPLYFQENQQRFKKFAAKIRHYVVQNVPADIDELKLRLQHPHLDALDRDLITQTLNTDNIIPGVTHWLKEFYQKESIKKALVDLSDDDICFVGDVDEIWNPAVVVDFTTDAIYKLRQNMYAYYLNNRSSEVWAGTLVTKYRNIKNSCLNHLRTPSKTTYTYIDNGGWHFTNQGGVDKIIAKLEAEYSLDDYNTAKIKSLVKSRMQKNQDYIGRDFKFWIDDSALPTYLLEHKIQYQHLFKNVIHSNPPTNQPIIIKLHGGLGNQLFQYATGRALALRWQAPLLLDNSGYEQMAPGDTPRQYSLQYFKISADFATEQAVRRLKRRWLNWIKSTYMVESSHGYDPTMTNLKPPVYLEGYWQSEKYFQDIAAQLRQEISLKIEYNKLDAALVANLKKTMAVSLHVRRGDYVSNPVTNQFHGTSPVAYYQAALDYMTQHISQPHFFVFSDDIAWVQQNLSIPQPVTFVSNGSLHDYEELILMALCQHHIIANSSFSWWGAWLNPTPQKIVIAPKKWFNDPTIDTEDLLPNHWIKM